MSFKNLHSARIQSGSSDVLSNLSDMDIEQNDPDFQVKTIKKSKRQRSLIHSTSSPESNKKKHPGFITKNKYAPIAVDDITVNTENLLNQSTNANTEVDQIQKTPLPSPIFAGNIEDFVKLRTDLINLIGTQNFTFKSTSNNLKIETKNSNAYREVSKYLKNKKIEHHTYQAREDRAFRVVIRNLHPSTSTSEVGIAINEIGYSVRNVSNVLHKTSKRALPLFFVDLDPAGINNSIFHLKELLNTKIKVEEPYKRREIIQCINCQEYGHSKRYCAHPPRCVRCAGNHPTSACSKPKDHPPTCALCGGSHTASYRGCTSHKDLQRKHRNQSKTLYNNVNKTKANVNFDRGPSKEPPQNTPNIHDNKEFPDLNQNSFNDHSQSQRQNSQYHTQFSLTDNNMANQLSSFLTEFKLLISPLIELLTTVIKKIILKDDH